MCKCNGANHGRGRNGAYEKLEDFDEVEEIVESMSWEEFKEMKYGWRMK